MRINTRAALPSAVLKALELKRDPFLPPRKINDIFYGHDAAQVEACMWEAIDRPVITAISGEVGSGKSLAVERFCQQELLAKKQYSVSRVALHRTDKMGPHHLCKQVLFDVTGDMYEYKELVAISTAMKQLTARLDEGGARLVVILEEAHLVPTSTLRDVKTLSEMPKLLRPNVSVVMVGQPELEARLNQENLRQLGQRTRIYKMQGLRSDLGQYVRHCFQRAGSNAGDFFDPEALKVLQDHPGVQTPLEVNHCCTLALGLRWKNSEERVSRELMLEALSMRDGTEEIDLSASTARTEQAAPPVARKAANT